MRLLISAACLAVVTLAGWSAAEEAKFVGKATCAGCHEEVTKAFDKTFHGRKSLSSGKLANACESCHGAGGAHADAGGDASKIVNPGKLSKEAGSDLCLSCHKDKSLMMWKTGSHAQSDLGCASCHSVHKGEGRKSLTKGATDTCLSCHKKQKAEMRLPSHHPVLEGKLTCASCHNPHGGIEGNLKADSLEETCAKCHVDKVGPFAFEHAPVADGCQNCHMPHGTANERLLKMPIQYLCLSCHKKFHNALNLTTAAATWRQRERCTDCHREIHGSDAAQGLAE